MQLSRLSVLQGSEPLVCRLTPRGRIDVEPGSTEDGAQLPAKTTAQILAAFHEGRGEGVLHLGAAELSTELPPSLSYWRDVGRAFVARVCSVLDPTEPLSIILPDPDPEELVALRQAVPPMQGAEFLDVELLRDIWADAGAALAAKARSYDDGVQGYLKAHGSVAR